MGNDPLSIILTVGGSLLLMICTFFLYRVSDTLGKMKDDISKGKTDLVEAIGTLREELAKEYVRNSEFLLMRKRVHDLGDLISGIKAKSWLDENKE